MKKSIGIWTIPGGDDNIKAAISLAKRTGFDAIELGLNEKGNLSLESGDDEIISYREYAKEQGIEIASLAVGIMWKFQLTHNNPDVRRKGIDVVKKGIDFAALLGTDAILVVPGAVRGGDYDGNADCNDYETAYNRALAAMKELAPYAEAKKINIGVENVWNNFLLSPLEMRGFVDAVGSDFVKVYFDVGNVIFSGFPEQWIKILGSRITRVHFKDFRREAGNGVYSGFVNLLEGDVNFPAVMRELRAAGYDKYLTIELGQPDKKYPQAKERLIAAMCDTVDIIINDK